MKSSGIIRRIDDLGRVVIPKEVRRTLNIAEGDPLELFMIDGMVCWKKYYPEGIYKESIESLITNLSGDYDIKNAKEIKRKLKEALELFE